MKTSETVNENNTVFGIDELSDYLNMSKSTIYKLVQEGRIPGQKVGRHWRFLKASIDEWIAGRQEFVPRSFPFVTSGMANISMSKQPNRSTSSDQTIRSANQNFSFDIAPFFTEAQQKKLREYSLSNLGALLIKLATQKGKLQLSELLKITLEELDQIASSITDNLQNQQETSNNH